MQTYKSTYNLVKSNDLFDVGEVDYIYQVFATLLHDCAADIDDLTTVVTAQEWEMTDGERLKRLEALYSAMQDKYGFVQSFSRQAKVLALQRMKEKKEVQSSRSLYSLKNERP